MARYMRTDLGRGHSRLRPPTVVTAAAAPGDPLAPIQGSLFPVGQTAEIVRRRYVETKLRPPRVVNPAFVPSEKTSWLVRIRPRPTMAYVGRPVVVTGVAVAAVAPPIRTRLAPSSRGRPQSYLGRPVVVRIEQIYTLGVHLARNKPKPIQSRLRPPTVVAQPGFVPLLNINLAPRNAIWRRNNQHGVQWVLRKPIVVRLAVEIYGPKTTLAQNKPKPTTQFLRPPTDTVGLEDQGRIRVRLAPSHRLSRGTYYLLRPPTDTVGLEDQGRVAVNLAYSRRGVPHSLLRPPVVIDLSPQTQYLSVYLTYSRRGAPKSALRAPAVVSTEAPFVARPVSIRLVRITPPPVHSRFVYPIVVDSGEQDVLGGVLIQLAQQYRPKTRSFLRPPVVAPVVVERTYDAAQPVLTRIRPVRVQSFLRPPTVVFLAVEIYGPETSLTRIRPVPVTYKLRAPRVVNLAVEIYGPETTLARIRPVPTRPRLRPPVVVRLAVEIYGPETTLTRIRPVRTEAVLRPPTVIDLRPQVYYLSLTLARNKPRPTTHFLRPPTDTVGFEDQGRVAVHLTYAPTKRPVVGYSLGAPAIVDIEAPFVPTLSVTLAYSLRGRPKSFLKPPTVVAPFIARATQVHLVRRPTPPVHTRLSAPVVVFIAVEIYGPEVHLAQNKPKPTTTLLRPPVVIDLRPQTYYLAVTLARNKPQPTTTRLAPPTTTAAALKAETELRVYLTYSRRGRPKSILRPPRVIDLRPQTRFLRVKLTYSRRGRAKSKLFNFIVRDRFFGPQTTLTYSRRGRPLSTLHPPVVVRLAVEIYGPEVVLTPSKRGQPHSVLRPPTVVGQAVEIYGPEATLAPSFRGQPHSVLRAPRVVSAAFVAAPVSINLTYSKRGRPVSFLFPPTRVQAFIARAIDVTLAPQSRRPGKTQLLPPAVVRTFTAPPTRVNLTRIKVPPVGYALAPPSAVFLPEPVLHPIQVTLAYSLRGQPVYFFTGVTLTEFEPDEGDVCGFDEAGASVTGTSVSGSTICGDEETPGSVSGGDQKATGA